MPAARGVLEHRVHLRAGNPGKPGQGVLDRRAALEVLEQGAHGHPRAAEYRGAAELRGVALNRRAPGPLEHHPILLAHSAPRSGWPALGATTPRTMGSDPACRRT